MKLTIVHAGGTTKEVELEDLVQAGGWVQVRYPHGAGCYRFALAPGRIEHKRNEQPLWRLSDADLERMRELAKERKIKWRPARGSKPRKPRSKPLSKQQELF